VHDPRSVAEHLHLDVPTRLHIALEVHAWIAEARLRLGDRELELRPELGRRVYGPHPATATTAHGLDDDRPPQLLASASAVAGLSASPPARWAVPRVPAWARGQQLVADGLELRNRGSDEHD
jgi:hypothetical protein